MHLAAWGYSCVGTHVLDFTALLCETPDLPTVTGWQDRTKADLMGETLNGVDVPESWALPGVTEARLREAMA